LEGPFGPVLPMELAADTKLNTAQHYSPTSTPVLDVFRPLPPQTKESLSAGEYFLASSRFSSWLLCPACALLSKLRRDIGPH
jgi:hypothetical protein